MKKKKLIKAFTNTIFYRIIGNYDYTFTKLS